MQLDVKFVGAQPNEQTPGIALYMIDARGQATRIAALAKGKLEVGDAPPKDASAIVALGPDVPDPRTLDSKSLLQLRLAAQLPLWRKSQAIEIPAQWWRQWLSFTICLSGKVSKCFPLFLDKLPLVKNLALGQFPHLPWEFCSPICNGVVEIWESTCCCFPFLLTDVPPLIAKLKAFLAENPVMFPAPSRPGPDPGPVERALERTVDRAMAAGKVDLRFVPSTQLHEDLQMLEASTPQDAVQYFQTHPSLWPIWCTCTSAKLGEAGLNPDGTFNFCFQQFPFILIFCHRSYFYKVKQLQGGQWVYIYDGAAANQYFSADEFAYLSTLLGNACGTVTPPPPGTDFATLQQIGSTLSYALHSHYGGVDGSNNDLTQTGAYSVAAPPPDGGLVNSNNAPWCKTLSFMLYFDPGMEALGAYYYRMSVAPADLNGNPVGPMQPIQNPIAWSKYVLVGTEVDIEPQVLGPNSVVNGSNTINGLYLIPYNADQDWLSGQFHQYFDTRTLNSTASGVPGPGNGRFLLAVEVFDKNGNRLVPPGVTPGTGDVAVSFQFLRLMSASGPGSTANVRQAALTHLFWADNRPVVAEIDDFSLNGSASSAQCQFLSGPADAKFQVGYRAYHAVMGDPPPNPIPPTTFMSSYDLWWERGLSGGSGTFDSGGDTNQPASMGSGSPAESPGNNGELDGPDSQLLPPPLTACSFAITLNVYSKHTDGTYHYNDLDATVVAAVALSRTS